MHNDIQKLRPILQHTSEWGRTGWKNGRPNWSKATLGVKNFKCSSLSNIWLVSCNVSLFHNGQIWTLNLRNGTGTLATELQSQWNRVDWTWTSSCLNGQGQDKKWPHNKAHAQLHRTVTLPIVQVINNWRQISISGYISLEIWVFKLFITVQLT